jgi:hypothetical protein
MPDNDAHADMTHAQHRLGVPAAERGYGPQAGQHEQIAAARIAELCASGDAAGARKFIHELEHGLTPWEVSPWRVLDAIAATLTKPGADAEAWIGWAKRQAEDAAAGSQSAEIPPGTDPVAARKLARDEAFREGNWTQRGP